MAKRYVILGASAAGVGAAARLRTLDPDAIITVIGDEPHYAYYRPLLPYVIDDKKSLEQISFWPEAWYARQRIRLVLGVGGRRVEPERKVVELDDGRRFDYDALLLAVGASSRIPDTPGITLRGSHPLRTVDDAQALGVRAREALHSAGRAGGSADAVLLGAGLVSLKASEPLLRLGVRCTFVVASAHVMSRVVDAPAAALLAARLDASGVRVIYGHEVAAVVDDGHGNVGGVALDTGEQLPCQVVVVGKGVAPNLGPADRSGLASHRGMRVGAYLDTSEPGVYAAGDCVETIDVVTGTPQVAALWTNAVTMANVAAHNMVHGPTYTYRGVIGTMNSTVLYGLPLVALGLTDPVGDQFDAVAKTGGGDRYRKLVFQGDRLVGAVFAGDVSRAGVYRSFIETGTPLTGALRAAAETGSLSYADVMMRGRVPIGDLYLSAAR
jgi:nitrite reductase (NADH) large subunit